MRINLTHAIKYHRNILQSNNTVFNIIINNHFPCWLIAWTKKMEIYSWEKCNMEIKCIKSYLGEWLVVFEWMNWARVRERETWNTQITENWHMDA